LGRRRTATLPASINNDGFAYNHDDYASQAIELTARRLAE
jgi:hypothetical protein